MRKSLIGILLSAILMVVVFAGVALAELQVITVQMDGMTEENLEKIKKDLKKLPGASGVVVELSKGSVDILFRGDKTPTIAEVEKAVKDSGLTFKGAILSGIFTFSKKDGKTWATLRGKDETFEARPDEKSKVSLDKLEESKPYWVRADLVRETDKDKKEITYLVIKNFKPWEDKKK